LTHFIIDSLLGTVTPAPPAEKVAPETTSLVTARTLKAGATADLPEANEPMDGDAKTVTLSTAAPVKGKKSAPAPAAAAIVAGKSDPKDAQTPAIDPTVSASDDAGKADDVTDKIKDGNKAEVDPILLLENNTGRGRFVDAFHTWNDVLQRFGGGTTKSATDDSTGEGSVAPPTEPVTPQPPSE
jgi:hypothetical protein